MKTKSIILSGLLLVGAGLATTSCEDMFTSESKLVDDDLTPKDTVYQMYGIIQQMSKVVDKTILLGEVRADLVTTNEHSSEALQDLASNNVSTTNIYNKPADFYNVINNCNIYLAYVDSALKTAGDYYYRSEIIAAKTFRAWNYLELAKIYGKVPYITTPIQTADAADKALASTSNKMDLVQICDASINDLKAYAEIDRNNALLPKYTSRNYFIPLRLMLAELYLYRGSFTQNQNDFIEAIRYYHDYLCFTNEEIPTTTLTDFAYWNDKEYDRFSWVTNINLSQKSRLTVVPMDTINYYGSTYSDLSKLFNSDYSNNYYASINPSDRLNEISASQTYTMKLLQAGSTSTYDTIVGHPTIEELGGLEPAKHYVGDTRFAAGYSTSSKSDMYHGEYSKIRQSISKYDPDRVLSNISSSSKDNYARLSQVTLYNVMTVYLHFAEALSRGGFPETAFALLKYGISETVLQDSTKVSKYEYNRLKAISSIGFSSNAADWDKDFFKTVDQYPSFTSKNSNQDVNQFPLCYFGCGDVWANKSFTLPAIEGLQKVPVDTFNVNNLLTKEDTLAHEELLEKIARIEKENEELTYNTENQALRCNYVDKLILDQQALEFAYEGHRFYDLMRYAKYHNDIPFLGKTIAKRAGESNYDASLEAKLSSENGWYLPLPTK